MLDSSDTGMSSVDNVTSMESPAFTGTGTVGDTVYLYANGSLVGTATVGSDETDGVPGDGRGAWEITSEPLDDDVYEIVAHLEDSSGNFVRTEPLTIEVDTLQPNTPFLDLLEADDAGRHNDDNITNADTVAFSATTSDLNDALHQVLFPGGQNLKFRIYVRPESGNEVLIYDSTTDASLPDLIDGLTSQTQIITGGIALPEGLHNLKLEVEDRAGNISEDFLSPILIDRTPGTCTAFLHPDSDTGVEDDPSTFTDGITSDATPSFYGTAEANSIVTIMIDGIPVGTAVALPTDGDDAFQPPNAPNVLTGNWRIDTNVFLTDGMHTVQITCEDPAGNRITEDLMFNLEDPRPLIIDTDGPKLENITRDDETFTSLFTPKPDSGPDPLIHSIVIHLS
ncbi:MAG: Ig-like domain-containing protein [Pirellulaceae bacterium]